jgi:FkbM family methyltransferase
MYQRLIGRFAAAMGSVLGPAPVSNAPDLAALRADVEALRRERDAALAVVEAAHPVCLLKGPRVTHREIKMAVHGVGDMYISECIRKYGIWEPTETDFIIDNLSAGDTFIDIGANIGYYSVLAADIVGSSGSVFGFEPDPRNFALLELNLALNRASTAKAVRAAVSDSRGTAGLHRSMNNLGDHRLLPGADASGALNVDTVRLDPKLLRPPSGKVTVKIDTQGWEGRIILGNIEALRAAEHIVFEWSPPWIDNTNVDPLEIIAVLEDAGYRLAIISEERRELLPFDLAVARQTIPALRAGSGAAESPIYLDIAATRTR